MSIFALGRWSDSLSSSSLADRSDAAERTNGSGWDKNCKRIFFSFLLPSDSVIHGSGGFSRLRRPYPDIPLDLIRPWHKHPFLKNLIYRGSFLETLPLILSLFSKMGILGLCLKLKIMNCLQKSLFTVLERHPAFSPLLLGTLGASA